MVVPPQPASASAASGTIISLRMSCSPRRDEARSVRPNPATRAGFGPTAIPASGSHWRRGAPHEARKRLRAPLVAPLLASRAAASSHLTGSPKLTKGGQFSGGARECPRICVGMSESESHAFYKQEDLTRSSEFL